MTGKLLWKNMCLTKTDTDSKNRDGGIMADKGKKQKKGLGFFWTILFLLALSVFCFSARSNQLSL